MNSRASMKAITILMLMTLVYGLTYLLGAFVCWDANPGNWPEVTRALLAAISTMAVMFMAIGVIA